MSNDDRDEIGTLMDSFLSNEDLNNLAAEELAGALMAHGIKTRDVFGDGDGVNVSFGGLRDAETMLTLAMAEDGPGTLYDRAASSCVTLTELAHAEEDSGVEVDESAITRAFRDGWTWMVHPDMRGRVVSWHTSACMSADDAMQVASRLNELRNGVAL